MGGHRSTNSLGRMGEEDEDESPGGGRCITDKSGRGGQGGSPMKSGKPHESTASRRTSSRGNGGAVAPSSTISPSAGHSTSPSSDGSSVPPVASRVVVPADDATARAAAPTILGMQHRVVSSDGVGQSTNKQQQQLQALQQQHRQHQFGRPASGAGGTQWDDVVGRMTSPQSSGHSLTMGSVDLSSNGSQPPVKSEVDSLRVNSNNSLGTWGSNDSQTALLGPMPPPHPARPPISGWPFDPSQITGGSTGNMVVDLSDVESLFPLSADSSGTNAIGTHAATSAGGTASPHDAPVTSGSSADAGAGRDHQQRQETMPGAKWTSDVPLPMEKVVIEPSRNVR